MKKEDIRILRLYIKKGSLIEYSIQYPNSSQFVNDHEYINFDGKKSINQKL